MMIKVGDFVKGISDKYGITNKKMTKAVVTKVGENEIAVKVLEHEDCSNELQFYDGLDASCFEVIGHQKEFDREAVLELLRNGCKKALLDYDLSGADLSDADLDFSCYPLWCGGLHIKTDARLAKQVAYHLCTMQCDDEEYIKMRNSILDFANGFHRVDECGKLEPIKPEQNE